MIDIAATRKSYNRQKISNAGLLLLENNVDGGLTKPGNYKALDEVMKTGYDEKPTEKWVFRRKWILLIVSLQGY